MKKINVTLFRTNVQNQHLEDLIDLIYIQKVNARFSKSDRCAPKNELANIFEVTNRINS